MKKRTLALFLAVWMTIGMLAGCGSNSAKTPDSTPGNTNTPAVSDGQSGQEPAKEAPMLADQVAAGALPALAERLPAEADIYVETQYSPEETPPTAAPCGPRTAASGTTAPLPRSLCSACWMTAPWRATWPRAMTSATTAWSIPSTSGTG